MESSTADIEQTRKEADELYRTGKYEQAIKRFKSVAEHDKHPLIRYRIGDCYYELKEYENAIKYLDEARQYFDRLPNEDSKIVEAKRNIYYLLGMCYKSGSNDKEKSKKFFHKA